MNAYLQHGHGTGGPFSTESVPLKETQAPRSGATATGYGNRLPTPYMVQWCGRWRRVYGICYSNSGSFYIRANGGRIFVSIDS